MFQRKDPLEYQEQKEGDTALGSIWEGKSVTTEYCSKLKKKKKLSKNESEKQENSWKVEKFLCMEI